LTAFLTAFYMFRVVFLAFFARGLGEHAHHHVPELMSGVCWALATLSVGTGLQLARVTLAGTRHGEAWLPLVSLALAGGGILLAGRLIALVTTALSTVLSIFIFFAYDREAAGFQFYEKLPLVPPLGISYEIAVDGISLLLVLLTSIIIFAGVFASWTIATRSQ